MTDNYVDSTEQDNTLYLTRIACPACETDHTFAHEGPAVGLDQEPPWPDVTNCPSCGADYPDDLAAATLDVYEAETVYPEVATHAQ